MTKTPKPRRRPSTRRPIEFKQAYAIAKALGTEDPRLLDEPGQWQQALRQRLVDQGWTYPEDISILHRARAQAEIVLRPPRSRQPVQPVQSAPTRTEAPNLDPPWPRRALTSDSDDWTSLRDLIQSLTPPRDPSSKT